MQTHTQAPLSLTDPLVDFDSTGPTLTVKGQQDNSQVGYKTYYLTGSFIACLNSASL